MTKATNSYEAWFAELKRIAWLMGWSPRAIASIDNAEGWSDYFEEGLTPAETWREELEAGA